MAVVDLRQVLAAFLTFSMFIMLGNMIKRDHIDPVWRRVYNSDPSSVRIVRGPWKEPDHQTLKPCWKNSSSSSGKAVDQSNGYIFITLTHGPEFHASQVANAVTVAKYLKAKLALPEIQRTKAGGENMKFEDIYDVDKFIEALQRLVQVDKNPPTYKSTIVRVPDRVSNMFVSSNIEPIFRNYRNLTIVTDLSSIVSTSRNGLFASNENQCLSAFEALKLKPNLQELASTMMSTIRGLSEKMGGRFIAVDLRVDTLWKKLCEESDAIGKQCYNAEEIGGFLTKIGFSNETTIYVTQTGWDKRLDPLRVVFPKTYTKDAITPAHTKALCFGSKTCEYERYIDFYVCAQSNVFVPAFPDGFYHSVVGKRIGNGNTQVFVPSMDGSDSAGDYLSPYIAKREHFAYSCFC